MLNISYVAYQPHLVITNTEILGSSLVLRMPEFVKSADGSKRPSPGNVMWQDLERERHLKYTWAEDEAVKRELSTDISGEAWAGEDAVEFTVTNTNLGDRPHSNGAYLFCLQAGEFWSHFHDYHGRRTFVRLGDEWVSVHEMQHGLFEDHRMCGYQVEPNGVSHNLMAKVSEDGEWALAMALDKPGTVSSNHQLWPSCIHTNPAWSTLAPGESETARGRVWFFIGGLDDVYYRFRRDFLLDK